MHAVFYDLETSDKNSIGQILNYCFILRGPSGEVLDELSGLVKLSRLQIPDPGAILANRTDLAEHQLSASDYEPEAMLKIAGFLERCIKIAQGAITLIGYNSSRFDLNYLRTSFIRNGINPYFNQQIIPRDLLHAVQKAYLQSDHFRQLVLKQRGDEKKLSLSLQTVGHALGLLTGEQAHESREDVVLTIKVAEWIKRECGIEATTYEAYEGGRLHSTARSGSVYLLLNPDYELGGSSYYSKTPVTLLDANNKSALWIDLERYMSKQSPECIMWRSAAKHAFFVESSAVNDPDLQRAARAALNQFKGINVKNYFNPSTCDIELDIYRIDFDSLDIYGRALRENNKRLLDESSNPDLKKLWVRRQLASQQADIREPSTAEMLRKYAMHRYGGKLQLSKNIDDSKKREQGDFHPTLGEMVRHLNMSRDAAAARNDLADLKLLDSLERYIRASDIAQVAGSELIPMWFGQANAAGL
ncbi:MAG: hypothetical protein ACK5Y6_00230 [Pseudomonadota bacterium]